MIVSSFAASDKGNRMVCSTGSPTYLCEPRNPMGIVCVSFLCCMVMCVCVCVSFFSFCFCCCCCYFGCVRSFSPLFCRSGATFRSDRVVRRLAYPCMFAPARVQTTKPKSRKCVRTRVRLSTDVSSSHLYRHCPIGTYTYYKFAFFRPNAKLSHIFFSGCRNRH